MEVNVKVTVELGTQALAVLTGLLGQKTTTAKPVAELFPSDGPAPTPAPEVETEKKTRTRRSAAEIAAEKAAAEEPEAKNVFTEKNAEAAAAKEAAPAKPEAVDFVDLDEEAQAEEIKAMVTRNVKKGKSADVKKMLAPFEAARASELAPDQYGDFYEMIKAYGAGASVDSLTALD